MMTHRALIGATLGALAFGVIPSGLFGQGPKDIMVHGSVLDSRGGGLASVQVEVWRQGKSDSKPTGSDGSVHTSPWPRDRLLIRLRYLAKRFGSGGCRPAVGSSAPADFQSDVQNRGVASADGNS